jgi:hypothetical protein
MVGLTHSVVQLIVHNTRPVARFLVLHIYTDRSLL